MCGGEPAMFYMGSGAASTDIVGVIIHMEDGRDLAMFRGLAARLGHELSVARAHISTDAAQASAREARGIFRVWTFEDMPGLPPFEPEFLQSAIDARAEYELFVAPGSSPKVARPSTSPIGSPR